MGDQKGLTDTDFQYPAVARDEYSYEVRHGYQISDPYRWLEHQTSGETENFIREENECFSKYSNHCFSREDIKSRLEKLSNHDKYSNACKQGNKYYFFMNSPRHIHDQDCLYVQDTFTSPPRMFVDPHPADSPDVPGLKQIVIFSFSRQGEILAYGVSVNRSDSLTVRFKSAETEEDFPDVLHGVKDSDICWLENTKGILYSTYVPPIPGGKSTEEHHAICYHALGTDQFQDMIVLGFEDHPHWMLQAQISDCGKYMLLNVQKENNEKLLFFGDILEAIDENFGIDIDLFPLTSEVSAELEYITNDGICAFFRTNLQAPNYKVVTLSLDCPGNELYWKTIIGEHPRNILDWVDCVNAEYLMVCYIRDVKHSLQLRRKADGVLLYTFLLGMGTISDHFGQRSCSEYFFSFTSFLVPDMIYRVNLFKSGSDCCRSICLHCASKPLRMRVFKAAQLPEYNSSKYVAKQILYNSHDGAKIPMFIIHKKSLKLRGDNPCLLYGYGGFGTYVLPSFSVSRIVFIQHFKGVVAIAGVRGGGYGEYGKPWYNSGRLSKKQNSVNDFISAAEHLINSKYTCTQKLVVEGRSNGGMLVATCVNQRPELFSGAVIHDGYETVQGLTTSGILDLLRFDKFGFGKMWISDYGDPEDEKDFVRLLRLSPLHNIKVPEDPACQYPAVLALAFKNDDRIVSLHSCKYIATMQQELQSCRAQIKPIMLRVDNESDAESQRTIAQLIEERTDIYCFLMQSIGLQFYLKK